MTLVKVASAILSHRETMIMGLCGDICEHHPPQSQEQNCWKPEYAKHPAGMIDAPALRNSSHGSFSELQAAKKSHWQWRILRTCPNLCFGYFSCWSLSLVFHYVSFVLILIIMITCSRWQSDFKLQDLHQSFLSLHANHVTFKGGESNVWKSRTVKEPTLFSSPLHPSLLDMYSPPENLGHG